MSRDTVEKRGRATAPLIVAGFSLAVALFSAVLIRYTDNFFADDSYFYLQVASNLARGLGSTFNEMMPTNGYHPVWLLVCTGVFLMVPNKIAAVHVVGVVLALLNMGALLLLRRALLRAGARSWWWAWLLYMPFCFTSQLGTEGALSGCFLAGTVLATMQFADRSNLLRALSLTACAALAVLSRLDNIFVIAALLIASLTHLRMHDKAAMRRLLGACALPLTMWAVYLASNLRWFGTLQPISGLLKAHTLGEHKTFTTLPRTACLDLAIVIPGVLLLALLKRDRFSRLIELPFAAGMVAHAAYVVFMMSSETRWSWYYTSWTLLAALVLARGWSALMEVWPERSLTYEPAIAAVLLIAAWYVTSYRRMARKDPSVYEADFEQHISREARLKRVLAFDKPGRIAFYTDTRVVPLDGLMGDLQFQQDLATKGIAVFNAAHSIDGFIGPPQPMSDEAKALFCDSTYLSSVRFRCLSAGEHLWRADAVEVFSRLGGTSAGSIPLPVENLVWTAPHQVAVWRLRSEAEWGQR